MATAIHTLGQWGVLARNTNGNPSNLRALRASPMGDDPYPNGPEKGRMEDVGLGRRSESRGPPTGVHVTPSASAPAPSGLLCWDTGWGVGSLRAVFSANAYHASTEPARTRRLGWALVCRVGWVGL